MKLSLVGAALTLAATASALAIDPLSARQTKPRPCIQERQATNRFTIPRHTTELDVCRQFYEACDAVSNRLLDNFCGVDRIPKIVSLKCIVTEGGVEGAQRYSYTRRIAKQLNLGLLIDDTGSCDRVLTDKCSKQDFNPEIRDICRA